VNDRDEADRLRGDDADDADERGQQGDAGPAMGMTVVGVTKTETTYPNAVGKFFAITPEAILGPESEGGTAALSALGGTIYACLTAGAVPASGSRVICHRVPYRWIFDY
jgi:hypothetical protein